MRNLTGLLVMLLVISIMANVVLLVRADRGSESQRGVSAAKPGGVEPARTHVAPAPGAPVDLSLVLAELRSLRTEVRELKKKGDGKRVGADDSLVSPSKDSDEDLSPVLKSDPAVAALLEEQEELNKLWKDLGKLSQLKSQLGGEKYREMVALATTEFLGLDPSRALSFRSEADQVRADLDRARQEQMDALTAMKNAPPETVTGDQKREVWTRYQDQRTAAIERLEPYLDSSPRHEQFRDKLQRWTQYYGGVSAYGKSGFRVSR